MPDGVVLPAQEQHGERSVEQGERHHTDHPPSGPPLEPRSTGLTHVQPGDHAVERRAAGHRRPTTTRVQEGRRQEKVGDAQGPNQDDPVLEPERLGGARRHADLSHPHTEGDDTDPDGDAVRQHVAGSGHDSWVRHAGAR